MDSKYLIEQYNVFQELIRLNKMRLDDERLDDELIDMAIRRAKIKTAMEVLDK